jgi:elongation factor Tu
MITVSAEIRLLRSEQGGRSAPVRTGYRPSLRFGDVYTMAVVRLIGCDEIEPGEDGRAEIGIPVPDAVVDHLKPDERFDLTEGPRKIGEGRITMVAES